MKFTQFLLHKNHTKILFTEAPSGEKLLSLQKCGIINSLSLCGGIKGANFAHNIISMYTLQNISSFPPISFICHKLYERKFTAESLHKRKYFPTLE